MYLAAGLAVLWFLNRQSGGKVLLTVKGFLANPQPPAVLPGAATAVPAELPGVQARVDHATALRDLFAAVQCKEASAAMDVVFDHLLDDHKTHAETK